MVISKKTIIFQGLHFPEGREGSTFSRGGVQMNFNRNPYNL